MKILADSSLPGIEQAFLEPFELSLYKDRDELLELLSGQEILLCRSTLKVDELLLGKNSQALHYVATASSGTDHIDEAYLEKRNIQLLDAKGSNASAVADYVVACLAFLQQDENFDGLKAGVIGYGEVGSQVVGRLQAVGLQVCSYDPLKSLLDSNFHSCSLEEIIDSKLICIHANLHEQPSYPSKNLIDEKILKRLKPGTVIINAARGGIVNEKALLSQNNKLIYCTDVYEKEPDLNPALIQFATLCTPHIAGHSVEAKYAAVSMISEELYQAYQLKPSLPLIVKNDKLISPMVNQNWQDYVLSLYNPTKESEFLKNAGDLKLAFQTARKAHKDRHSFVTYLAKPRDKKIGEILGFNSQGP